MFEFIFIQPQSMIVELLQFLDEPWQDSRSQNRLAALHYLRKVYCSHADLH